MEITKEELTELISNKETANKPKPTLVGKKIGKWATIIILVLIFGIGTFGSFNKVDFHMNDFIAFLEGFKWYFTVVAGSVGLGTSVKNITKVIDHNKEGK